VFKYMTLYDFSDMTDEQLELYIARRAYRQHREQQIACSPLVNGTRTDCSTGEVKKVSLHLTLDKSPLEPNKKPIVTLHGGVTGYESFYLNDYAMEWLSAPEVEQWAACMGTKGRYDELLIPTTEMRKALRELGVDISEPDTDKDLVKSEPIEPKRIAGWENK